MTVSPPETVPEPAGSVAVDIGGNIGAAVIYTPATLVGAEIEIRPADGTWDGTHTGIWEREAAGTRLAAAVFGSLAAGSYQLRIKGQPNTEHPTLMVIDGARVTYVNWHGHTPPHQTP